MGTEEGGKKLGRFFSAAGKGQELCCFPFLIQSVLFGAEIQATCRGLDLASNDWR